MLNDDKTQFLRLSNKQQLAKVDINNITVGESVVNTKPIVTNLGSWFDSQLSMSTHISKLCSSAFFHLHNIRRIRKFLSPVETNSLVHAFVTSRVDHCNSLLYVCKILLFAFKAIHGIAPTYIQNLVYLKSQGTYNLRSSGGNCQDRQHLELRSHQAIGPFRWLRPSYGMLFRVSFAIFQTCILFKSNLKTYFFKFGYG